MARTSAQQKKTAEREALHKRRTVTMTFEATENTIQRIAALLMLADLAHEEVEERPRVLLPWEEEGAEPPKLELDYNAIRNDCVKWLPKFVEKYGKDATKALFRKYGGETIKTVPDENTLDLLADLETGCV